MSDENPIDPVVPPSSTGCVECMAEGGWWFHLRRCAECGHIGCCDASPSQHASRHAAEAGHPLIRSFEPGEDWFWDYRPTSSRGAAARPASTSSARSADSRAGGARAGRLAALPTLSDRRLRPRAGAAPLGRLWPSIARARSKPVSDQLIGMTEVGWHDALEIAAPAERSDRRNSL